MARRSFGDSQNISNSPFLPIGKNTYRLRQGIDASIGQPQMPLSSLNLDYEIQPSLARLDGLGAT